MSPSATVINHQALLGWSLATLRPNKKEEEGLDTRQTGRLCLNCFNNFVKDHRLTVEALLHHCIRTLPWNSGFFSLFFTLHFALTLCLLDSGEKVSLGRENPNI
ncbi:hypothetical protein SLE2022_037110 [Rubroshorea leprosula]